MPFQGGPKEAAKMLAGMDRASQERLLTEIARKDPQIAELLRSQMVTIEDLINLTTKMLQELLREINLVDLGMALRISSPELRQFFLNNVSSSMAEEINDVLKGKPQPVSKVDESVARIMEVVRKKVDRGELVLNSNDEYV